MTKLRPLALLWLAFWWGAPDSVLILQPSANQVVAGKVTFSAKPSRGVATVEFDIGSLKLGRKTGSPFSLVWNTGYAGDGNYQMQAIGRDSTGNEVARAVQSFVIQNHRNSVNFTSPNLSQPLSGSVQLTSSETDSSWDPYVLQVFIDGTVVGSIWTDNIFQHTVSGSVTIDTTQFLNGPHEFNATMSSQDTSRTTHNYGGGYNRIVDIENGHTLMDVAANYEEVYLAPNGTTQLGCRDLYTDGTSAPCSAPSYSSSTAAATVDSSGLVTAAYGEGFSLITVSDQGKSTQVYVTVRRSPGIPHFSTGGRILTDYTPGQSVFTISMFLSSPSELQNNSNILAAFRAAGINTLSQGILNNPRNTSQNLSTWEAAWDSNYGVPFAWAAQNGFSLLLTGDDITRGICTEAWYMLNWPSGQQAVQYAFSHTAGNHNAIGVDMVDETDMIWGPTPYPTTDWVGSGCTVPKTWITTLRDWITSAGPTIPISWPNLGIAGVTAWANWDGTGGVADYVSHYYDTFQVNHTYPWSAGILEKAMWFWKPFYDRQPYMMLDKPQIQLRSVSGMTYVKESPGAFYNPPADIISEPGDIGPVVSSGMMSAAALGSAGIRLYFYMSPSGDSNRANANYGTGLDTGTNPVDTNREVEANWLAISAAGNAIKALTPYLLAHPLSSPAYGRNILTAARQGADGRMLLIVNDNDFQRTIAVDLSAFAYSGGTITKYLVGADFFSGQPLSGSPAADTVTLNAGESVAYVFTTEAGPVP